jgi:predicted ThiF/HesA family dinucleotide-utilizing enzyme
MEAKKISKTEPKKRITRYPDTIKTKAIQLYREGKSVLQIVEELKGPREKAIIRYLRKSGIDKPKRK